MSDVLVRLKRVEHNLLDDSRHLIWRDDVEPTPSPFFQFGTDTLSEIGMPIRPLIDRLMGHDTRQRPELFRYYRESTFGCNVKYYALRLRLYAIRKMSYSICQDGICVIFVVAEMMTNAVYKIMFCPCARFHLAI